MKNIDGDNVYLVNQVCLDFLLEDKILKDLIKKHTIRDLNNKNNGKTGFYFLDDKIENRLKTDIFRYKRLF